jgi:hypothetical protein
MEVIMDILSISELMHLTREELCDLSRRIEVNLAEFEAGSVERAMALTSLANIRRVMVLRRLPF